MPSFSGIVGDELSGARRGLRLDCYIAEKLGLLSRSQIKARELKAGVNGKEVKISRIVKPGDTIELFWNEAAPADLIPEDIPLDIIYEDERAVVINKPQGMVVHPGAGNRSGTVANALFFREQSRTTATAGGFPGSGLRPGIVHRLDKETSGVMITARDDEALAFLAGQFKSRKVKKTYIAVINGTPREDNGSIETFIARDPKDRKRFAVADRGRAALTHYRVIKKWQTHSLVLLRPKTGRTHQLRVHLRYIGHPVTGDPLYGIADNVFPNASLMLHSRRLAITLPGETEQRHFKAPLPERFTVMIRFLNNSTKEEKRSHKAHKGH
jgi:23S rRNA pseudouridine1911/1915/1917 synthase